MPRGVTSVESLAFGMFGVLALLALAGAKLLDDRDRRAAPRSSRSSFPPRRDSNPDASRDSTRPHLLDRSSHP